MFHQDSSCAGFENAHEVNTFDKLLIFLSSVVGQMSLIGFSGKLVKPRLRVWVEFEVHDTLSDFWCQAFSERPQKTVENGMFHVFFVLRSAMEK